MKNNAIMNGLQTFGTAIASGCKKHAGLLIATVNIASTCVLIYEVWTRKEKIQKAIEGTKDAPLKEKVKVVGKEMAPVIIPAAMSSGSAIAGAVVIKNAAKTVADMTVKTGEIVDVANNAIDAKDQYQKAAKEVVGEDKEKEIREKALAADNDTDRRVYNQLTSPIMSGCDLYYDETNPGFVFPFNEDKARLLEAFINNTEPCMFDDQVTLAEVYDYIEDMTNTEIKAPSTATDLGWKKGTRVRVKVSYCRQMEGRALMELSYSPSPKFLYNNAYND